MHQVLPRALLHGEQDLQVQKSLAYRYHPLHVPKGDWELFTIGGSRFCINLPLSWHNTPTGTWEDQEHPGAWRHAEARLYPQALTQKPSVRRWKKHMQISFLIATLTGLGRKAKTCETGSETSDTDYYYVKWKWEAISQVTDYQICFSLYFA